VAHDSPINDRHRERGASFLPWGDGDGAARVVETFGELELEYAAIRKRAAVIDLPQRGTIVVGGDDRLEFLDRMLTQAVGALEPGHSVSAFWVNRQGRILADLRLTATDENLVIDVDALASAETVRTLDAFLFAEEVTLDDASDRLHRLAVHGPAAKDALAPHLDPSDIDRLGALVANESMVATLAGARTVIDRRDTVGEVGLQLTVDTADAPAVYDAIATDPERVRAAGWHAWNIARIEAGTPIFNLDFGPDSLPAETGVLHDRVSFTKGCYPGQEIVARMHSRGHPKQALVGLRITPGGPEPEWQPMAGAHVYAPDGDTPIGAVTSSTRSPMLSDAIVCFAAVKWAHAEQGSELAVDTARGRARATVRPSLRFYPPD